MPLYAQMGSVAGLYFKGHHAGLAIYINQLMELPSIFMNLGLFIWSGMLLKQSRVVDLFMDVLRPWNLSPQLLTYIILPGRSRGHCLHRRVRYLRDCRWWHHLSRVRAGWFASVRTGRHGDVRFAGVVLRPLPAGRADRCAEQTSDHQWPHWGFCVPADLDPVLPGVTNAAQENQTSRAFGVAIPRHAASNDSYPPYVAVVIIVVALLQYPARHQAQ